MQGSSVLSPYNIRLDGREVSSCCQIFESVEFFLIIRKLSGVQYVSYVGIRHQKVKNMFLKQKMCFLLTRVLQAFGFFRPQYNWALVHHSCVLDSVWLGGKQLYHIRLGRLCVNSHCCKWAGRAPRGQHAGGPAGVTEGETFSDRVLHRVDCTLLGGVLA